MAGLTLTSQLFCFQLLLFCSLASSTTLCSHDQSSALLQFKKLFSVMNLSSLDCDDYWDGPSRRYESLLFCGGTCPYNYSKTVSWKEDIDCCSWEGVTCDTLTGHVIGLDLCCSWLQGNIPSNTTLFLFSHLQTLNLAFNNFNNSPISSDYFSRFPSLTYLNLSNSNFSGDIPSEISHLSKLVSLDLSSYYYLGQNNLSLETPVWKGLVQNLTKLTELTLDEVDMSKIMPSSFTNLSSFLTSLSLNDCGLQGNFPDSIFHLPNLQLLSLARNFNLTGNLPKANWSITLKFLDVSDMGLFGELPNSIGNLVSLKHLELHNCTLYGSVPASLGNLTQLTYLSLWYNNFTGHIPLFLSNLKHLHYLDLSSNNFFGEFPDIFSNLTQLSHLYLEYNQLGGQIPFHVSGLQNLITISLFDNSFTGIMPSWLFTLPSLKFMSLRNNKLTWPIDEFHSNLLQYLSLENMGLQGSIPSSIFELVNLTHLSLSSNNLSVTVEDYMFAKLKNLVELDLSNNPQISVSTTFKVNSFLPKLQYLYLSACNLSEVPKFFTTLDQLKYLQLSHNPITTFKINFPLPNLQSLDLSACNLSEFPKFFVTPNQLKYLQLSRNSIATSKINFSLPKLQSLDLSACNLSEFPKFLRSLDQLVYLDLSDNKLLGQIPDWIGDIGKDNLSWLNLSHNFLTSIEHLPWKKLEYVDLHSNLLKGPLPIPPPKLILFQLSNNNFSGEIPHSICSMTTIQILDVSSNNLSGIIPECIGNISSLHVLDLRKNKFYGTIPRMFTEGNHFRTLNFNDNGLEGLVSRSLVNCTMLEVLDLGNNKINDTFPYWLGSLTELQVLVLHSNKFYGSISSTFDTNYFFSKLRIFDLSNNNFSGSLPVGYFQNLNAMVNSDNNKKLQYMGEDYYQDSVFLTLKGFQIEIEKIITVFTTIDFSNNSFDGKIPKIMGKLQALRLLNLSHNSLEGCIPSELGNIHALESLDLSLNKLVGKIPWELTRLNFLQVINFSENQLTGPIPRDNHFDTFPNTSYEGNSGLCGFPLSNQCGTNETLKVLPLLKDNGGFLDGFSLKVVLIGYGCGVVFGVSIGYLVFSIRKPQWLMRIVEGKLL